MSYTHDHEDEVTYFAKTTFRNQQTKFGIKTDDRRRHVYIIGKTGMGKTTLMENMILSDIYAGHGCCYVDPHGDTAEKLLDYIPSWRINDVVYFNPSDVDFPVGFNILEAVGEGHKHLVASGMMGVFKKIWENMWSSRMEYILNNTILALLDNPGSTLLGINRMLSDADYRRRIVGNIKDPIVKQFWASEFAGYSEKYATEAVAPIQNKIGQFLSASIIRNIVAQVKSTIDVRELMDSQKIFIINLSKGRIGEDNSRLLGGMLITKIQLSAMERVDIPEEERKDFYLYVDEFQNFAVESFAAILSEARKYRLCLTMAHQYIAQLSDEVREAVFGNVGTIISYRVGSPDAVFMEQEFAPRFVIEDIINLPKFNVYLKLLIDGVTSQPFSATTLPPIAQRTASLDRVIRVSRERYAVPRTDIEEKIMKWSGFEGGMDVDTMMERAQEKKKAQKDSRKPKHEYECTRCGKHMVLPVELDRSRPIYCEDCIDIVREERKQKKKGGKGASTGPDAASPRRSGPRSDDLRASRRGPHAAPPVDTGGKGTKRAEDAKGAKGKEESEEKPRSNAEQSSAPTTKSPTRSANAPKARSAPKPKDGDPVAVAAEEPSLTLGDLKGAKGAKGANGAKGTKGTEETEGAKGAKGGTDGSRRDVSPPLVSSRGEHAAGLEGGDPTSRHPSAKKGKEQGANAPKARSAAKQPPWVEGKAGKKESANADEPPMPAVRFTAPRVVETKDRPSDSAPQAPEKPADSGQQAAPSGQGAPGKEKKKRRRRRKNKGGTDTQQGSGPSKPTGSLKPGDSVRFE